MGGLETMLAVSLMMPCSLSSFRAFTRFRIQALNMEGGEQKDQISLEEKGQKHWKISANIPQDMLLVSHSNLSKSAKKKLLKQQVFEAKKAEKKALMKEQKEIEVERRQREWLDTLGSIPEEERSKLIEARKELRKGRMERRSEEKEEKMERLIQAQVTGQKIVIDLEFSHLMTPNEINSLFQQVCYKFFSLKGYFQ
ncbi:hypothetical protein SAY86_012129 [Trapa natans]|uniref:tRNA (guanine(9)-N(1))-methyltransferase n=1 Tax=Trapa natans TaxID=22666 RepID=A0AAN7RAC9_TRANT|nr:hypothetical protein SAY86_012129 [Trapa natans]